MRTKEGSVKRKRLTECSVIMPIWRNVSENEKKKKNPHRIKEVILGN